MDNLIIIYCIPTGVDSISVVRMVVVLAMKRLPHVKDWTMELKLHKETVTVPDGTWVVKAQETSWRETHSTFDVQCKLVNVTIGLPYDKVTRHEENVDAYHSVILFSANRPFGLCTRVKGVVYLCNPESEDDFCDDGDNGYSAEEFGCEMPPSTFEAARQVHKGELGRYPEVELPYCVEQQQAFEDGEKGSWVWLADLARFVGMEQEDVLRLFHFYGDRRYYLSYIKAAHKDALQYRIATEGRLAVSFLNIACAIDDIKQGNQLWVRRKWANAVTNIVHFRRNQSKVH
ncbi:MAG: hypothetical protein WCX71_04625 [Candidatus Buchananbacteria bacterium]